MNNVTRLERATSYRTIRELDRIGGPLVRLVVLLVAATVIAQICLRVHPSLP